MVEFHSSHGGRAISYGRPTQRGRVRSDAAPILIGSLVVGGVISAAGIALIPSGSTGTAVTTSATRIPTIRQAWTAKAWITRPMGNILKHPVYSPLSTTGQRVAAAAYRAKSLYGYGMLGMALMNPLENINYIRKGQWDNLVVNIAAPLIGIPIYEKYKQGGVGSPISSPIVPPERMESSPKTGTLPKKFRKYERKSPRTSSKSGGKSRTKSPTKSSKYTSKRRRGARAGKKYCKKHSKYDYCHRWKRR
jgi:hypothetical protein